MFENQFYFEVIKVLQLNNDVIFNFFEQKTCTLRTVVSKALNQPCGLGGGVPVTLRLRCGELTTRRVSDVGEVWQRRTLRCVPFSGAVVLFVLFIRLTLI